MNLSSRKATYQVLDSLEEGTYYGRDIQKRVKSLLNGNEPYVSSVLKYCRDYASDSGSKFICLDNHKSHYKFEPSGFKICGAFLDK